MGISSSRGAWPSKSLRDDRRATPAVDWSAVAPWYDWQRPLQRAPLRAAVELVDPRRDDVLLDVATGTGGLLRELARRENRPGRAIGVDVSAAMLARIPPLPDEWSVTEGDARGLDFADGEFSVATAAYLLHVVASADRGDIIGEVLRVLRPGGRFVTVTPAHPRTRLARMLYAPLAAAAGSSIGPAAGLRPLDPRQDLAEAGFTIAGARYVSRGFPSLCILATR